MEPIFQWIREHDSLLTWLGVASAVMFVGTLIVIPMLIVRIPRDYFREDADHEKLLDYVHPALRIAVLILKNVVGVLFILAGVAMLILPGQGILAIVLGLMLMNFPGKRKLEIKLVRWNRVNKTMNWIRRKAGKPPLEL